MQEVPQVLEISICCTAIQTKTRFFHWLRPMFVFVKQKYWQCIHCTLNASIEWANMPQKPRKKASRSVQQPPYELFTLGSHKPRCIRRWKTTFHQILIRCSHSQMYNFPRVESSLPWIVCVCVSALACGFAWKSSTIEEKANEAKNANKCNRKYRTAIKNIPPNNGSFHLKLAQLVYSSLKIRHFNGWWATEFRMPHTILN